MRKQLRVFARPFRKTYRLRRSPRRLQMSMAKRRKRKQEFRRLKTARLRENLAAKNGMIAWSPKQLARVWKNITR